MKTFTFFILLLLIATGAFAGMLYAHVVPVSDLADRVPGAGSALASLGLYPSPPDPGRTDATPPGQQEQPIATAQPPAVVHSTRHRLHSHRTLISRYENVASSIMTRPSVISRVARIYDTMPASYVARIMAHQSDAEAARELAAMNASKAGEVIAVIQPLRAARIAAVMAGQSESGVSSHGRSSDEVSIE